MKFLSLALKSALRSRRRTALTVLSVAIAVFLFASLRAVLEGLQCRRRRQFVHANRDAAFDVAVFLDADEPCRRHQEDARRPGHRLGELVWRHLQGSAELLRAVRDRTGKLSSHVPGDRLDARGETGVSRRSNGLHRWRRPGAPVRWKGGDHSAAGRDSDLRQRGLHVHRSGHLSFDGRCRGQPDDVFTGVRDERSLDKGQWAGSFPKSTTPTTRRRVASAIDQKFANTPYKTKTDTEKQFQSTFVSMFGNLNMLLGSIALAVVIATLFVAANTMASRCANGRRKSPSCGRWAFRRQRFS